MGRYIPTKGYRNGKPVELRVAKPNGKASLMKWAIRVKREARSRRLETFAIRYDHVWVLFSVGTDTFRPPEILRRFPSEEAAAMWMMYRG